MTASGEWLGSMIPPADADPLGERGGAVDQQAGRARGEGLGVVMLRVPVAVVAGAVRGLRARIEFRSLPDVLPLAEGTGRGSTGDVRCAHGASLAHADRPVVRGRAGEGSPAQGRIPGKIRQVPGVAAGMRFSLLDRSRTRTGRPEQAALTDSIERAVAAEQLGDHRFWAAEHHTVPGIASGAPAVLLAAISQRTARIRLGSGGVMLPNHRPLVVTEQFLMLAALAPGRVDLGLGRSLGFTAPVREALGRTEATPAQFAQEARELRGYLEGTAALTARPALDEAPPLFLLATGSGLDTAAQLGLPVVLGGPVPRLRGPPERLAGYRRAFRPTGGSAPAVILSADVLVADTDAEARQLALSEVWAMVRSREMAFPPLEDPARIRERAHRARAVTPRAGARTTWAGRTHRRRPHPSRPWSAPAPGAAGQRLHLRPHGARRLRPPRRGAAGVAGAAALALLERVTSGALHAGIRRALRVLLGESRTVLRIGVGMLCMRARTRSLWPDAAGSLNHRRDPDRETTSGARSARNEPNPKVASVIRRWQSGEQRDDQGDPSRIRAPVTVE